MFSVTKHFLTGLLAGLTITERTSVQFIVGRTYKACTGGGTSYRVTACDRVSS